MPPLDRVLRRSTLVLAATLLVSCIDDGPPDQPPPPENQSTDVFSAEEFPDSMMMQTLAAGPAWLECTEPRQPRPPVQDTFGPAGGTLRHVSGHELTVPPGVLTDERTFALHEPVSQHLVVIALVQGNISFDQPITLTLAYGGCNPGTNAETLEMYRFNASGNHDNLDGTPDQGNPRFSANVDRLSAYLLATN